MRTGTKEIFNGCVDHFLGKFEKGPGRLDPGSDFKKSQGVPIPVTNGSHFGKQDVEVPAVFSDGFVGQSDFIKDLNEFNGVFRDKLVQRKITDIFEKQLNGFQISVNRS